jgi:hypothetical protein
LSRSSLSLKHSLRNTLVILSDFGSTDRIVEVFDFSYGCSAVLRFSELRNAIPKNLKVQETSSLANYESIIIGSGVDTQFVDYWILEARRLRLPSGVLLDSWVNYQDRFSHLPDNLIVTDLWAYDLARKNFPSTQIKRLLPDRTHLWIEHTNQVESVLVLASLHNNYTEYSSLRHSDYCVCPEMEIAKRRFPGAKVRLRPHPKRKDLCDYLFPQYKPEILRFRPLHEDVSSYSVALGPPSYAHYYLESIGVPAFFTETTNKNWSGPQFRLIN